MIDLDSYPLPVEDVVGRVVEGAEDQPAEAVLVLPEKGQVKVLNEVGARIWSLVDGQRNLREIAHLICQEYEVDASQAETDVLAFVEELAEGGVVKISDYPGLG